MAPAANEPAGFSRVRIKDGMDEQLRALKYRAWHRGTREADIMIGGYFDAHSAEWDDEARTWFSDLLNEQDVDIMAWAIGTAEAPARFQGPMLDTLKKLDFIRIAR
jgi:antitoxin CptB